MPRYINGMEFTEVPRSVRIKFLIQGGHTQESAEKQVDMEDKIKHLNLISKQIYGKKYKDLNIESRKEVSRIYRKEREEREERGTVLTGKF